MRPQSRLEGNVVQAASPDPMGLALRNAGGAT